MLISWDSMGFHGCWWNVMSIYPLVISPFFIGKSFKRRWAIPHSAHSMASPRQEIVLLKLLGDFAWLLRSRVSDWDSHGFPKVTEVPSPRP
jgi:hypothetical protein